MIYRIYLSYEGLHIFKKHLSKKGQNILVQITLAYLKQARVKQIQKVTLGLWS